MKQDLNILTLGVPPMSAKAKSCFFQTPGSSVNPGNSPSTFSTQV